MQQIPLHGVHGEGRFALVDDADFEMLSLYRWTVSANGYALRPTMDGRRSKNIWMHRVILDTPKGLDTDHINGDKLDNRRANLRIATRQQNQANQKAHGGASVFKGVDFRHGLWQAQIGIDYDRHYLGFFDTQRAAAQAYNEAATQCFGEFAKLNDLSILAPEDDPPVQRQGRTRSHKKESQYLGVFFDKRRSKFVASVIHQKKFHYGGQFDTELEAAIARDELAKRLHGVLAKLNFPDSKG